MINYFNNHNHKILKITITDGYLKRNIIYKNIKLCTLINYCNHFEKSFPHIFNTNETIMSKKLPVTDIYYFTDSEEKKSVRHLINNYADKNKYYENNSIKNIFEIENIKLEDIKEKKIYVNYMRLVSKKEKVHELKENDYHVSELFDVE